MSANHLELYNKYRPKTLKGVVGQPDAVRMIQSFVKRDRFPHAIMLTGGSGCGKTTIARIIKSLLDCSDKDFNEINCAGIGIDKIRDLRNKASLKAIGGKKRIVYFDEAHKLTTDAQNGLLKMVEDPPEQMHYIFATTDPQKIIKTIHTRCTEIQLKSVPDKVLGGLVLNVCSKEGASISADVQEALVASADGSPRKALVILDQIIGLDNEEEQLASIAAADSKQVAFNIAKALIWGRAKWPEMASILKDVNEDPEQIRYLVLSCARGALLKGGPLAARAYLVITAFRDNFYDSKHAGLAAACWEVISG